MIVKTKKSPTFTLLSTLILLNTHSAQAFSQNKFAPQTSTLVVEVSKTSNTERAEKFIASLSQEGISFLQEKGISENEKREKFRVFLNQNFDLKTIARFALGRYWRSSTKEQKKEYLALFEDMVVDVYARRFGEYDGQNIEILQSRSQGKADILVSSSIIQNNGPKIGLDWRVRNKKDGSLKIIDLIVEGVSMSLTQRSDFASVIQRGGGNVEALLKHLRDSK